MKKDDIYRSQFRLPYSLYEKLKESAEANNRSVNAELVARLEIGFYGNNQKFEDSLILMQNQLTQLIQAYKEAKYKKLD